MNKTTELEAVNTILRYDGKSPINSLEGESTDTAIHARAVLTEAVREVQSRGWFWNTEVNAHFVRNTDHQIVLPKNVLSVCVEPVGGNVIPILRGNRLYNVHGRSYAFAQNLQGTMVLLLDFEEMPEVARRYCTLRAARQLLEQLKPDTLPQSLLESEQRALNELIGYDATEGNYNYLPLESRRRPSLSDRF